MPIVRIVRKAASWFARNQRPLPWRETYDPYHVWVSEIMLQQTRMEVVLGRYDDFLQRFPTIRALAAASEDEVTAAWSGLGYYRRARMLRSGAQDVMSRFGGSLPSTAGELMTIAGIGRYTAGAIASIAFNRHAPIVDGNIKRIVSRLFASHSDPWKYARKLVEASSNPRVCNQALMEIGALICKPRSPECARCPLRGDCAAYARGLVDRYPRVESKKSRSLTVPLYVILDRRGRLLLRRETGPLMTGLFHLPHGNEELFGSPLRAPRSRDRMGSFRHSITTRRVEFVVYRVKSGDRQPVAGDRWFVINDLDAIPHPSYVRKALRVAGIVC